MTCPRKVHQQMKLSQIHQNMTKHNDILKCMFALRRRPCHSFMATWMLSSHETNFQWHIWQTVFASWAWRWWAVPSTKLFTLNTAAKMCHWECFIEEATNWVSNVLKLQERLSIPVCPSHVSPTLHSTQRTASDTIRSNKTRCLLQGRSSTHSFHNNHVRSVSNIKGNPRIEGNYNGRM